MHKILDLAEAELVGVDDASSLILWTKLFMEAQGYNINQNIIYQANKRVCWLRGALFGNSSAGCTLRGVHH
jgi:hypothetical protein